MAPTRSSGDAMAASIARQRASVRRQAQKAVPQAAGAQAGWFSSPWPSSGWAAEPISMSARDPASPMPSALQAASDAPDCDPLPLDQVNPLIRSASAREGVREDLVRAVIERESAFRPCAVSPKGAQGLMQLMPATARDLGVADPFDPQQSVDGGVRLLKQLLDRYKGNFELALSAYNAGAGRVDREGGVPDIAETKDYVLNILSKLVF